MQELKRHKIVFSILHPFLAIFAKWKFCYTYDSLRDVEGPYLLLPNHNLELDPIIVGVAAKKHLYFVASEHLSRKGFVTKLLNYFLKPIYHQKGRAGAHTVKEILKTLRSGTSVCLFPEGNRSFNGQSLSIPAATGKMAKRSGVKLVTYRFEGHYLTQPRWATTLRRGKLRGRLVHVYTPEELAAMTDQEVNDAIVRDLWEDAYETQAKEMVPFKGKHLALGMESTVFACPACRQIGTLKTDDTTLTCTCGFHADYDVYGYLTDRQGEKYTITRLDELQRNLIAELAENETDSPLFSDQILLQDISDDHELLSETHGALIACRDKLIICGKEIPFEDILGMSIYSRNVLVIHTLSDSKHYEIRGDMRYSALKYLYLFEIIKKEI